MELLRPGQRRSTQAGPAFDVVMGTVSILTPWTCLKHRWHMGSLTFWYSYALKMPSALVAPGFALVLVKIVVLQ